QNMPHFQYTHEFLDKSHDDLAAGRVHDAMGTLHEGLTRVRNQLTTSEWQSFGRRVILPHPIKNMLHKDWLTRRSFEKPRGYAGDAEMLDFLYQESVSLHAPDCIGEAVGRYLHGQ